MGGYGTIQGSDMDPKDVHDISSSIVMCFIDLLEGWDC